MQSWNDPPLQSDTTWLNDSSEWVKVMPMDCHAAISAFRVSSSAGVPLAHTKLKDSVLPAAAPGPHSLLALPGLRHVWTPFWIFHPCSVSSAFAAERL